MRNIPLQYLRNDDRFTPSWREDTPHSEMGAYEGRLNGIPIYSIAVDTEAIIVVDLDASLSVCRFADEDDSFFHTELQPIDASRARELLDEDPGWKEHFASDGILSEEETVRELRQRVLIQVSEYIEFIVDDDEAGLVVEIEYDEQK